MNNIKQPKKTYQNLNNTNIINSDLTEKPLFIDIAKTPEENIEIIINKDILDNSSHISKIDYIYELLIRMQNFKEFIMLNNIHHELIYEILSTGTLKQFKKKDYIYKKHILPEYYYLVLAGEVGFQNSNELFLPGNFFGEKYLMNNKRYRVASYSNKDNTILLLIQKDFFIMKLKNKILKGTDKIKVMLLKSFKIFRNIERKSLNIYIQRMIKLFPSLEEIIITNKDIADSIFLVYDGSCVLNSEKQGDLIILEKGDIFGNESLSNITTEGKKRNNNYKYNVINKSQNTIIFKFLIKNLSKYITNGMKTYLAPYFKNREEIIKTFSIKKKVMNNNLKKEYDLFKRPINQKEIIDKYCFNKNIITNDNLKKSFNNALFELRLNRKNENFKKKLMPCKSIYLNKKALLFQKYFQNKKSKSFNGKNKILDITSNSRNINSNNKSTSKGQIRKMIWFVENNKVIKNQNKRQKDNNLYSNFLKTKTNTNFNYSSKILTMSDNNNNNNSNFYLTSISPLNKYDIPNLKDSYKFLISPRPMSNKDRTINTESSYQNKMNRRLINSAFSSKQCSTYFKSNSNMMSIRKQIETYGCTILDTLTYFNNGISNKMLKRNFSVNNKKIHLGSKKNLFYETPKYNIPLYVLCDKKEKIKFPEISNF